MSWFSVVTLSKNPENLIPCVRRIFEKEPGLPPGHVIVVDDGAREKAEPELSGVTWVSGVKPFVFARNANAGIMAALDQGAESIILLNDDALLDTPGGFDSLWRAHMHNRQYGLLAPSCNTVGNGNQLPQGSAFIRPEPRMLCFTCVLIPRATVQKVGLLGEEYVDYGLDDDCYSLRVRQQGFALGVWDGCFVDHGSLTSTYRGDPRTPADFRPNLRRFIQKHGVDNWGKGREESQFPECFDKAA